MSSVRFIRPRTRTGIAHKVVASSEVPRTLTRSRSVAGDIRPVTEVPTQDIESRCLQHDASLREKIYNLVRTEIDTAKKR